MSRHKQLIKLATTAIMLASVSAPVIAPFWEDDLLQVVEAAEKKQSVVFQPSTSRSQSKTVTIPNLGKVRSVTTDTGTVSYSVSGNKVTLNVSGGDWVDRTWDDKLNSKTVTNHRTSSSNSFPSTNAYSDSSGYSGTLSKNGSSTVQSGKYTAAQTKTVTEGKYTKMRKDYHRWNSSQKRWLYYRTNPHPDTDTQTRSYNKDGYKGTLNNERITHEITKYYTYPSNPKANQEHHYIDYRDTRHFTGKVTKPASDTRVWRQNYRGTAYKGGYKNHKYAYNVVIEYDENDGIAPEGYTSQSPTSITKDPVDILVSGVDPLGDIRSIESTSGLSNNKDYGRNLLTKSGDRISNSSYNIARYDYVEPIKDGERVTVTLKGKLASGKTRYSVYNSGGSVFLSNLTHKGNDIHQATFNWKKGNSLNTQLYVYAMTNSQSGTSTIDWIKLERGGKGTPYTPSPETEGRENLVNESNAVVNSGSQNLSYAIDPKSLRGKTITLSVDIDLVNGRQGSNSRHRIGWEPAIRYEDGTTQYLGLWHQLSSGSNFSGRISNTFTIQNKPIARFVQTGMYVQLDGDRTRVANPKMEFGSTATPWKLSKAQGNLASSNKISTWGTAYNKVGDAYTLKGKQSGIKISTGDLKPNTDYVLTFNLKKNSGTIRNIAGHSTYFDSKAVYIDGKKTGGAYGAGGNNAFPNDNNPHEVQVHLRTQSSKSSDPNLYIQPNRGNYNVDFNADVSEIYLEERPDYTRVFQASSNGTYNFRITDTDGNSKTVSHKVSNIDTSAPTGSDSGNPTSWTKNNVTLTVTASDALSGVKRIKTPAGTWVNGSKATHTVSSNGTYTFVLEDNLGNTRDYSVVVNRIDKTLPNGTITGNPTSWTKNNATLTFTATDSGGSGVRRVRQSGGSWVNGNKTTRTVSANGTYSFEVEDNAGNVRTVSATVNRIDKTAPGGTISGNPSSWTNGNVTLTFTGTDSGGSGVKRVRQSGGSWVNGNKTTRTVSENGTYSFEVEDNAGNTKTVSATVNRIDKTLPNGTITGNPTAWTNKNVTLTFNATDSGGSGVKRVRQSGGTWVNGAKTTRTVSANGTYSFEVEDNAGNVRTISVTVNRIDKTVPGGSIAGNPTSWTNKDATLTFTATDSGGSGVKRVRQSGGTWVSGNKTTRTVSANGTYSFEVEDNAGNVKTISTTVNRIDKTLPNGTITGNPTAWTNQNVTLNFTGTDSGGAGVKRVRQSGGTWVNGTTTSRTVTANGTYSFEVEDNAGNVKTVSVTVNRIDKVKPENKGATVHDARYVNGNTHWVRPGDKFRVDVSGYDAHSQMRYSYLRFSGDGNDNRAYHDWNAAAGNVNEFMTTSGYTNITAGSRVATGTSPVYRFNAQANSTAGNRTFQVHTYFTDKAGNTVGYVDTGKRIRTDATAPTITANVSSRGWGNGNVSVALTHSDGQSGIKTKQYKWSTSTTTPTSWDTYTGTTTQSSAGTWYLHGRAVDNVGRVTTQRFGPYRIDKTAPTLSISGNPSNWVGEDVKLTIKASDTGGSGVKSIVLPNGNVVSGTQTTYTVPKNGKLTFEVIDHAGNSRSYTIDVTKIDKTNPTGNVKPSTTNWTNKNVTLTVTSSDSQSGIKEIVKPDGTKSTSSSTTFIVERNGTYTFTIIDRVNNKITKTIKVSNIDKEAPSETILEIVK